MSAYVTNPLDMAKVRYQIQRNATLHGDAKDMPVTQYKGLWDTMKKVHKSSGILGLFRGTDMLSCLLLDRLILI